MAPFDHKREISFILSRRDNDGGFQETQGGGYRPDATAWVILCLDAYKGHSEIAATARARLRSTQKTDGSIPLSPDHPEAFWPTFPGALAFYEDPEYKEAHVKAIDFIISTIGLQIPNTDNDPIGHDSMLKGWPWIDHTHAWVEPTAMSVRALTEAGLTNHDRTRDGVKLLLNRQLMDGGWNFGNTSVYGQQQNPMPSPTGMVLWALDGHVEPSQISSSIQYLQGQLARLITPLSLGWALRGLASWNIKVENGYELAVNCLRRQHRYGSYNTSQVAILLLAISTLGILESENV